ncbi:hypothetical protein AAX26_00971 [Aliarcobacter thereius]|uniref:hypothetical protein n=1 Tax=Aliarcobacter thereius TaxID=544718 RepID=UPI0008289BBD|nr:hypothetical protein [Aliarcobacter thereius]OCL87875.1 hypothetical protein AAX26_00971 [Aliarcobacter thereius]
MIKKIVFFLVSFQISLFSCADYWDPNSVYYLFLDKRDNVFLSYSEDLKSPGIYNTIIYNYDLENKKENLKEWQKELKGEFKVEEIEEFLYKRKNLDRVKNKEVLDYINFVAMQEECVYRDYYYYYKKDEKIECGTFVEKALDNLEKVNSNYLKLRYFYLALRLAHFEKKEPLIIYEKYKHLLENSEKTIVKDWIQGIYAGALVKSGEKVKGVFEFSKLLDNSINQHLALYNFHHITSEEEFNELLKLSKNDEERTKFYALRALNSSSNRNIEIQNIYNLDKNSKWLDFLLYKNLLESQIYFNLDSIFQRKQETSFYTNYIEILKNLKRDDNYLVDISLAYFYIFSNQLNLAEEVSKQLQKEYPNSHEVETLSFIIYLNSLNLINEDTENEIFEKLKPFLNENHHSNAVFRYTVQTLASLYKNNSMPFEELLLNNTLYLNFENLDDLENFRKFEEFLVTKQNSKLKEYIQESFKKRFEKENSYYQEAFEMAKVKILINNLEFNEALNTNYEFLNQELEFNPFNVFIKGNNRNKAKKTIKIKDFLNNILEVKKVLEKDENSSMDNYLFANAMYNLSYFGNSDRLTTFYRSTYYIHTKKLQKDKLELAVKHYEKAYENSVDNEFKAKITYHISKAKLALFDLNYDEYPQNLGWYWNSNNIYIYGNDKFYNAFLEDSGAVYFDRIRNDFKDTKFYQQLLYECGDFGTYVHYKRDN